jgi:PIN domain nuclease of toxin-antitoxin system
VKVLLDTHTFLWWDQLTTRLPPRVSTLLQDISHERYISSVNLWEIKIKTQAGKLSLSQALDKRVEYQIKVNGLLIISIEPAHIYAMDRLPNLPNHRDPFDRLLVAQALHENMAILSADPLLGSYPVQIIW